MSAGIAASPVSRSSFFPHIELLRFYIADKKRGKRASVQENELKPLPVSGNTTTVPAGHQSTIVVAIEKFTISDAKFLGIQLMDKKVPAIWLCD